MARESEGVLAPVRAAFRAVAEAVVPESVRLDEASWREVERIVETALGARPARVRRQLVTFIRLLSLFSVARFGRPLAATSMVQRARLLDALQRSRIALLRRGTWGLRTLVLMGYYGRPEAAAEIGYRASARGWEARR